MIDGLADDIEYLVVRDGPDIDAEGRFRVIRIGNKPPKGLLDRVRRKLSLEPPGSRERETKEFLSLVNARGVSCVLAHFLTHALAYEEVWPRTTKTVFIHCHGVDITWDKRKYDPVGEPEHPVDFVDRVRALPSNVRFIANSSTTQERLRGIGIDDKRISVKHLGVEAPEDFPEPQAANDETHVLFVGRLVDCKGPDLLIRAFELACEGGLKGNLIIAGDGPLRVTCELLRARSKYKSRISLLGAVDGQEVTRLHSQAQIFSAHNCVGPITRQEEAYGVSFLEAMASGLPVVTGRQGGFVEFLEHEVHGLLCTPGNVDEHAEMLLRLHRDPELRRRLGYAGWKQVREHFTIEQEISQLRNILGCAAK